MTDGGIFRLDGRVALITGAGTGLGRQFAQTLAQAGADVILAARRQDKLAETRALVEQGGGTATVLEMDVSDLDSVTGAFDELERLQLPIDILVNNAGINRSGFLAEIPESDWDAVLDTNLKGAFLVARATARRMIKRGKGGSIINIASILGFRVSKALGPYIAAKSALLKLTQAMALEWAQYNIRVNSIAPGYFPTDINDGFLESERGQALLKIVPMRRAGSMPEIAGPVLLLASDAGSYMTGSNLTVDGGHLCSSL